MKSTHELMIFVGKDDKFHVVTTSLRFDIYDWMSFKAIRSLVELNAFGRIGKSSLMLVPTASIEMASNKGDLLLKHGDVKIEPVYVRDPSRGSGLQPNSCFMGGADAVHKLDEMRSKWIASVRNVNKPERT